MEPHTRPRPTPALGRPGRTLEIEAASAHGAALAIFLGKYLLKIPIDNFQCEDLFELPEIKKKFARNGVFHAKLWHFEVFPHQ